MKATASRILAICAIAVCISLPSAVCQNPYYGSVPDVLSLVNVGGNIQMAQFARLDFAQMILEQQRHNQSQMQLDRQKSLLASGTISTFDLAAPHKAVDEFNKGTALLRGQDSAEAMAHLQKAIAIYPKFVSAHNRLGLVYLDADDVVRARSEFDTAASLDARFAGTFLNLGRLALSQNDFAAAAFNLEKASSMLPADPAVLTSLAYAQNGNREYRRAIETVAQVHSLPHKGMGAAHYIAAIAALSLEEYSLAETEFRVFLAEEPSHPLAAAARQNIQTLERIKKQVSSDRTSIDHREPTPTAKIESASSSNSERLRSELNSISDLISGEGCGGCESAGVVAQPSAQSVPAHTASSRSDDQWTFRKTVNEVDVFFTVDGNKHVSDLTLNDILIQDNNQPPAKVLRFSPQSRAPLRLGVLIDTSGSVGQRLSFEKRAAEKILQQLLTKDSDLAFIAGFSDTAIVTQDFTADRAALAKGIGRLTSEGGTALFDALSFACWKLAAYPEDEEVAKVLIVLTDGEDNAGHTSLRQTVRDEESTGVTLFTISAKEVRDKAEAEKVLQALAERSGGEALFPGDLRTLTHSLDKLHDEIQNRYFIAYAPADFRTDGRYRAINIAAEKDGKQLQIHARKGYYANLAVNAP
jgi:VWFA-related protein